MALSLPSALTAALASGAIVARRAIVFDFPSGMWGFWEGSGDFVHDGITHHPSGSLLEISDIPAASDMASAGVTVRLRAVPDAGLSSDVLGTIESEQYHQRPVTISVFFFDPQSLALLASVRLWSGYVDTIAHDDGPTETSIVASLESRSRDHGKAGWRTRTTADQQSFSEGDLFFRAVGTVGARHRLWGRAS